MPITTKRDQYYAELQALEADLVVLMGKLARAQAALVATVLPEIVPAVPGPGIQSPYAVPHTQPAVPASAVEPHPRVVAALHALTLAAVVVIALVFAWDRFGTRGPLTAPAPAAPPH